MQTLKAKKSKPYSFLKNKTARIFEQALKSGLTLPACKRPADIERAGEGEFCPYHRILGHTIEECWVFKDLIEEGHRNRTIQLPKSFQQDPALHSSNNKGKGVAYTISHTPVPSKPKVARRKPIKEIYRSNSVMNIEIEEEMAALEITVVPERHFKDLMPREVNHIQTLKTFVVPTKVERIKGKTIIHKAIIFYQSDSTQSVKNPDHNTWKKWVIEQESENATSGDATSHPFGNELYKLAKKAKCLRDISKAEAKRFDELWNGGQNKVIGPDGKIKYTRGLGYNCDDAACFEGCATLFRAPPHRRWAMGLRKKDTEIPPERASAKCRLILPFREIWMHIQGVFSDCEFL
jgi:hypothetical protein